MKYPLETIRHSFAHILAMAVLELYSDAKLGMGPAIENGFYYDFDFGEVKIVTENRKPKTEKPQLKTQNLTAESLPKIEAKMRELIAKNLKFTKKEISVEEAKEIFANQPYKLELIDELQNNKESIIIYTTANCQLPTINYFVDLCKGPHIDSTKDLNPEGFKLTKLAGAYWKGDEKNHQLQRIYGIAFETKKELDGYLKLLEEAEKRDHRKIGRELELFMFSEDVGPGLPLWLPKGMIIREELERLAKKEEERESYVRVWTPHIARAKLYEMSGHIPYYSQEMYPAMKAEDGDYYLKPMNCPHHYMVYKHKPRSYRDLPMRIAEYGTVYRYEKSGELLGLFRPRGFTQNDAHIFCSKEQIKEEFLKVMNMHVRYYKLFGIKDFYMRLSLGDPKNKEKFIDNEEMWRHSEKVLKEAMKESGLPYRIGVGEAAFYGPKVDFQIKNVVGKEYSSSTNQLDFSAGSRFNLTFTNKDAKEETAFVIHRSPLGSHERFIAFLIEHYAGAFPFWLAPIQTVILPVNDKKQTIKYSVSVADKLKENNIRVVFDDRNESVGKKIREAELQKIPYILVIGDQEVKSKTVSVRERGRGDIGGLKLDKLLLKLLKLLEVVK